MGASIRYAGTAGLPWQIDPGKKIKYLRKDKRAAVIGEQEAAALRRLTFTSALLLPDSKTGKTAIALNAPALAVLNGLSRVGADVIAGDSVGSGNEKPRVNLKRP